jgi:hypothetical protein
MRNKPVCQAKIQEDIPYQYAIIERDQAIKRAYLILEKSDLFYLPFDFYVEESYPSKEIDHKTGKVFFVYKYFLTIRQNEND